jgi:hypothetical protein
MTYIIRANPNPEAKAKGDAATYWVPQGDGTYIRTSNMANAVARGFDTREKAVAFMKASGIAESAATEVIEVADAK